MTGWDGPRGTTLTCLRGAFRLMENTHHALWVKRLQTSTPIIIIIILKMQAEFFKSSCTTSLLINSHPNSSSNIHTLWHEEPLKTQLALSGWGFPLWGGVNEGGVSVVMMHIYSLLHKAISHVTIWSLIWNNPPNHFRDFLGELLTLWYTLEVKLTLDPAEISPAWCLNLKDLSLIIVSKQSLEF